MKIEPKTIIASICLAAAIFTPRTCNAVVVAETAARFRDWKDAGCRMSPGRPGMPPSAAANPGGNQAHCATCTDPAGVSRWFVSEPDMNVWLVDEPLSYLTSGGDKIAFRWYYKQRFGPPLPDECFTLYRPGYLSYQLARFPDHAFYSRQYGMSNAGWAHNWMMSVMVWDYTWEATDPLLRRGQPFSGGYEALVFRPEGGVWYFYGTNATAMLTDALSRTTLQPISAYPVIANPPVPDATNIYWGEPGKGMKLTYADGSQDVFGLTHYYYPSTVTGRFANTTAEALLTQKVDAYGRTTQLGYEKVIFLNSPVYRLKYVVDPDSRTNTFIYSTNSPVQPFELAEVRDPYGRRAQFTYANGVLTAITDPANNNSSYTYRGSDGWITNLATPFGQTSFDYYQETNTAVANGFSTRAVLVKEPDQAKQLFIYLHHTDRTASNAIPPSVPGQTFDDGRSTAIAATLDYRNSFHWGRLQYRALSASVLSSLSNQVPLVGLSNAVPLLSTADLKKSTLKHWLLDPSDSVTITHSLSSHREPSPDSTGTNEGSRIWYSYPGKTSPELEGQAEISGIARSLPDGATQYSIYTGVGTWWENVSSAPLADGSAGALTNWFQYAANGLDLVSVSNSVGQSVSLGYNTNHQVTALTNAPDRRTSMVWDNNSRNLKTIDLPEGERFSFLYYPPTNSATGSLLSTVSSTVRGLSLEIKAYTNGLPMIARFSGTGLKELWVTNSWDPLNRLTATVFPDGTSLSNRFEGLSLTGIKDRLGSWTYFGYDGLEHLTSIQDARSNTTQFGWCDCGSLTSITDASNRVTQLFYNNQGLLTNVVYPSQKSVTNFYDPVGRLTTVQDGEGRTFSFAYNNLDLVTSLSNAFGRAFSATYDPLGRPAVLTDAHGVAVTHEYDLLDRLTRRFWQDGIGESFGYATNGLVAYTNRNGKITRFARDGAGRLTAITNANLETVVVRLDALDHVLDLWDGLTNQTSWNYNEYGWVSNKFDHFGNEVARYAQDPNGQVTNAWSPQFGNKTFRYDPAGNLTNVAWTIPQAGSIAYTYDKLNQLSSMSDALGLTTFGYTANGELASEAGPWVDDLISWTYKEGRRMSLGIGDSVFNFHQSYSYDDAWRLQSLDSPAGTFTYGYGDGASPLVRSISLPNFASITKHYDALGRLDYTALLDRWGHSLDGYSYTHDALGLRTNIVRELGIATNSIAAGYDPIGQLTSWSATEGGIKRQNEQFGWAYDKSANLRYRTNGALVQTFTNNALNQLTGISRSGTLTVSGSLGAPADSVTVNGQPAEKYADLTFARTNNPLTGTDPFTIVAQNQFRSVTNTVSTMLPASVTLTWDANGNLTSDGTLNFQYDAYNRLVTNFVANAWKVEFVYDGIGRRRIMREYGWQGSGWGTPTNETRYLYDGMLPIQERNGANAILSSYTRGLDLSGSFSGAGGIGGLLARTDATGSLFYHADGVGNITALMDPQGRVRARYEHGPFGRLIGKWGPLADINPMRFSSMPIYAASGLSLYSFRAYDPDLQRWLSRDPIGLSGGVNLYGFVGNSPINFVDPLGLQSSFLNPEAAQMAAEIESGAFESQAVASQLAREAATRAAVQRAFQEAAAAEARRVAIKAGLAAGALVIMLPNGDMYSPPLPKVAGSKGPPGTPPCTTLSAPPFGPGDNEGAARGREAHKWWQPPSGFQPNFRFNTGEIADAVNIQTREILEMKTSAAEVAKGWQQIARYIKAAQEQFGGKWTGRVVDSSGQPW